jgi:hypothetical protein
MAFLLFYAQHLGVRAKPQSTADVEGDVKVIAGQVDDGGNARGTVLTVIVADESYEIGVYHLKSKKCLDRLWRLQAPANSGDGIKPRRPVRGFSFCEFPPGTGPHLKR